MKEISSDAPDELFVDMLADEESIIRKVFGISVSLSPPYVHLHRYIKNLFP